MTQLTAEAAPARGEALGPGYKPIGAAAAWAGVSEKHLRRLAAAGRLRFYRLGRRVLVDIGELAALIQAGAARPAAACG
jgi:excisionase family DNA binding protein